MYLYMYIKYVMYSQKNIQKEKYDSLEGFKKAKNLTNKQLAKIFGITEGYISHYFTGRRRFGGKKALEIHEETGVPIENLIR